MNAAAFAAANVKSVFAFVTAFALVIVGIAAVPMTVAALAQPLTVSCMAATIGYDPGYGVSQLAASPSCTIMAAR